MKKRILSLLFALTLVFTSLSFTSCDKTPSGKNGFFDSDFSTVSSFLSKMTFGFSEIYDNEKIEKNTVEQNISAEFEVKNTKFGFDVSTLSSYKDKTSKNTVSLEVLGTEISAELYSKEKEIYLGSNDLLNKYISYEDILSTVMNDRNTPAIKELSTIDYKSLLSSAFSVIKDNLSDEKFVDGKQNVTVNNETLEVSTITLELSYTEILTLAKSVLQELDKNEDFNKLLNLSHTDDWDHDITYDVDDMIAKIDKELEDPGDYQIEATITRMFYNKKSVGFNFCTKDTDGTSEFEGIYIDKTNSSAGYLTFEGDSLDEKYEIKLTEDKGNITVIFEDSSIDVTTTIVAELKESTNTIKKYDIKLNVKDGSNELVTALTGTFKIETISADETNAILDANITADEETFNIKLTTKTDLNSTKKVELPEFTSENVYDISSDSGINELYMDFAEKIQDFPLLSNILTEIMFRTDDFGDLAA